jgi:Leucine-rich repeat (LRR) protein
MAFVPESVKQQLELCKANGTLNFSNCRLTDIPEQVFEQDMPYLKKLDFSHNRLTELSPFITRLQSLEFLDLTGNILLGLPNEIGMLRKLKSLRLGENGIKILPRTLGLLSGRLEELAVDMSNISWPSSVAVHKLSTDRLLAFLSAFHTAEDSKCLDLTAWNFSDVPDEVLGETSVTTLKLPSNQLSSLPERISILSDLRDLHLDKNRFADAFPAELLTLTSLTKLSISGNEIRHLAVDMTPFQMLRELRVSDNVLQSIPPSIGNLRMLTILDVSFNQLTILPSEIGTCISLQILRARSNQLRTIPIELTRLGQARAHPNFMIFLHFGCFG